jgi:Na+-transporting NADH:ubiquinone oxidoreductase subunit NqrC
MGTFLATLLKQNSMIQRANVIPREVQNSHLLSFMNYWISVEIGDLESKLTWSAHGNEDDAESYQELDREDTVYLKYELLLTGFTPKARYTIQ